MGVVVRVVRVLGCRTGEGWWVMARVGAVVGGGGSIGELFSSSGEGGGGTSGGARAAVPDSFHTISVISSHTPLPLSLPGTTRSATP